MSVLDYDGLDYHTGKFKTWVKKLLEGKSNAGHKHTKSDITDFPKLGTASVKDVASTGNASTTQVVMGNDTRLSDARKASDVYDWAKSSTKPTYTASEVGAYTKSETDTKLNSKINTSLKGSANGLAELDSNGKVPSTQLPSFVDDVIEGYLSSGKFYKESAHTTQISGESGKIYIDLSTGKTYRWSGSAFVVISETLALGETSSTAYRGDRGKTAYDHSQSTHARTDATKVEKSSTNGNIKINGTETTVYTHPSGTNPHGTTKSDVGLGNVGNFKAVSTVSNQGLSDTEKSNARSNIGAQVAGSYANSTHTHDNRYLRNSADKVQTLTTPANNVFRVFSSGTIEASIIYTSKEGDDAHSWVVGTGVGGENNFGWWDGKSSSTKMYLTRDGDLHLGRELYLNKGNAIKDYTGTSNLVYHDRGSQWYGNRVRDTYIATKSTQGIIVNKLDSSGNVVQTRVLDGLNYSSYALPLSGGTITGAIKTSGNGIINTSTGGSTNFSGGTDLSNGATLILRGKDQNDIKGMFELATKISGAAYTLIGNANSGRGVLSWNGYKFRTNGDIHLNSSNESSTYGLYNGNDNMICISYGNDTMYSSGLSSQVAVRGTCVGNGRRNTRIDAYQYLYFYSNNYISANQSIATASDEKVKRFSDILINDHDALIEIFDIINPKSYKYKYSMNNSESIGFSAQEVEKAFEDNNIDPTKYSIINIEYNYMMSRGDGEEDFKYYTKFMEISYNDLYNLAILKIKDMEEKHMNKLNNLEERLSALESKEVK